MRLLPLLAAAGLLAAPQQAPDDGVLVDEIRKEHLEKVVRCQESRDWKGYWAHVAVLNKRYGHQFVASGPDRWTSVREHLLERSAALPREAVERYRYDHEPSAIEAFGKARESGDRAALEIAAADFFFSAAAAEVLDRLAREAQDAGRPAAAAAAWQRLLRFHPDPGSPAAVLAAKAAHAWTVAADAEGLASLRSLVAARKISGRVSVAGRELELADFLASLDIPSPPPLPVPSRSPSLAGPDADAPASEPPLTNEIRRWVYDFAADRGETSAVPEPVPAPQVVLRGRRFIPGRSSGGAPPLAEFPLFPAYGRVGRREVVVFTDGFRVVAVDPSRVQGTSPTAGVYWKHPEAGALARPSAQAAGLNRPYVGVTVDGEHAFVTTVSPPQLRPREAMIQGETFEGVTAVKCLHLLTGGVVWDTDSPALLEEFRRRLAASDPGFSFYDRSFSFCGPPRVSGSRVFLGVCTSPAVEQEAAVLCLDRATGRPLWASSIASFAANRQNGFPAGRVAVYQTLLAEDSGLLLAQTNLGVVAGLDPATGRVAWLSRYRRARVRENGQGEPSFLRPANWPVPWRGRVYVLPQDRPDLLAFESATGRPIPLPTLKVVTDEVDVRSLTHLLGVAHGNLVLSGSTSHVVQLSDFRAFSLSISNAERAGRGVISGNRVYLSVSSTGSSAPRPGEPAGPSQGVLGIYDQRTWKSVSQPAWRGENEFGNLLAAGRWLVVAAQQQIAVYADADSVRREYRSRIAQSPPRVEVLLEYGDLMRENERLEEAAEAYLDFIRASSGDARWEARSRQVKADLHAIFLRRGEEASDPRKALEFYAFAKGFSHDEATRAEATRRLAESLEKAGRWKDAVVQYQELIERARGLYHREAEGVRKLWQHARERVEAIVKEAPDAYEEVERRAAEALEAARKKGAEALRDVMDRFPNSKTAEEAWRALRDRFRTEGALEKLRGLFRDFEDRFRRGLDFQDMRDLLDVLEKTADVDRLRVELDRFAAAFGDRDLGSPEKPEKARDWAARKRSELPSVPPPGRELAPGPLARLADLEARVPGVEAAGAGAELQPVRVLGREPAGLPAGVELFARGSAVELWDVAGRRRLWSCPRPGAYAGVAVEELPDGSASAGTIRTASPADRAGLRTGDLILALDGRAVSGADLAERLAERAPGDRAELLVRRGQGELRLRLELEAHPAELRPWLVGASWTCDGSLAAVWEDVAASIDPASGRVQWVSRELREGFAVRAFRAVDGRLFLYEAPAPDEERASRERRGEGAEAVHRLLALSDVTGDLIWAHPFPMEAGQGGDATAELHGRYFGEHVSLLQSVQRSNGREWTLWTFKAATGEKPDKRVIPGELVAYAVDEAAGTLYYVTETTRNRQERSLQSRSIDPSRKDFKQLEIPLRAGEMVPASPTNATTFTLAAEGEFVVLLAAARGESRLRVFRNGETFRSLSLREGRTLPQGRASGAILERGVLHVLNLSRDGIASAFLTAFRIDAPEPSGLVAWESVAPLPSGTAASWTIASDGRGWLGLLVPGGMAPASGSEGPAPAGLAAVYDRSEEGRLRLARPAEALHFSRGRLYVVGKDRLEVYGK